MAYSYEQGIIDGDKTQEKFLKNNPTWVDLNKKVKRNYVGADFWLPKELRGNILYGPKLELKGRNCNKVDPYKNQMEDSDILVVEFDGDGEYHLWYMKDFVKQSEPQEKKRDLRQTNRRTGNARDLPWDHQTTKNARDLPWDHQTNAATQKTL